MPTAKQISRTERAKVLLVDDNPDLIKLMSMRLKSLKLELRSANSAEQALSMLSLWSPHLVITDLQMSGMSGMDLFKTLHAKNPLLPVIILTAHGTIPDAVSATQAGVASFLSKPFDGGVLIREIQTILLANGFTPIAKSERALSPRPSHALKKDQQWRNHIVSQSPIMEALINQIDRLAPTNALLLFEGEPGSGKDVLIRAAHARSQRAQNTLSHISCSALPEPLLESEIYGRVGTGSVEQPERLGMLRETQGGTFVLNDFDQISPAFIRKLLRAMIDKKAKPIDADIEYDIDVRPMTSSAALDRYSKNDKRSLELGITLDITVLSVPPLREHREDIPLLINQCMENMELSNELQFSARAMQLMMSADWPGNVRQLTSVVRQCARLCRTKVISETLVNSRLATPFFSIQSLTNAHRDFERNYLTEVLKATNGNVTRAASLAKRNRTEFHRLLKKHKIEAGSFRH